jgi:hypothetical protein
MPSRFRAVLLFILLLGLASTQASTQGTSPITTPKQHLGANIGDDYFLASYSQLEAYWKVLDRESDRLSLVDIGRTTEGRTQWMAVISAPENMRKLDRYKAIARRLALADGVNDAEARALAAEGRTVVWIDGGLHADEVLGAQQLIETVYQLVSRNDPETRRFLADVIVLAVDANPDGHELVANWYMRQRVPAARTLAGLPTLYQKYAGHDNNRDFYMSTQQETQNINRVLFEEWLPQIVYDHHQTAPAGTVMFAPPFRGPFNYVFDPLVPLTVDLLGAAMHTRMAAEGKPGVTMRSGSNYSTWWNGGLRTTVYFHNQIGLLTETIGSPTPSRIPYVAGAQLPTADLPAPIEPQEWRFRQSIDYSMTANRAVLDVASRNRELLLFNIYRMGRNSIDRGSRDHWTPSPHRQTPGRDPDSRDPRGYIISSDQPDFPTATKFVEALMRTGVRVERATSAFTVGSNRYPAGSFIVKTAQAFRPHVLDMFEPQDHPDDIPVSGGTPTPPYDSAGWTLAFQMGVQFERVLDAFDGPFERVPGLPGPPRREAIETNRAPAGYLLSHQQNDAFAVINRLLAAGESAYFVDSRSQPGTGERSIFVPAGPSTARLLQTMVDQRGVTVSSAHAKPGGPAMRLQRVRVGLWDRYGGSVESGWLRFVLERFGYPHEVVYAQALDAGNLAARFDVLIFPDAAIPGLNSASQYSDDAPSGALLPPEYRARTGVLTVARTIPQLRSFVEQGGTLLAFGSSTAIAQHLGLPVSNALAETRDGRDVPLSPDQYFVPGSVLRARVDTSAPLGYGFREDVDVFFDNSPVFKLAPGAADAGVRAVAWFADSTPLRSGWAWGQSHLRGGAVAVEAAVGRGRVVLYGPSMVFRGQSHGTFRFLFNGIHLARAVPVNSVP